MKKMQYFQPQTEVVMIKTNAQLLEGSPNKVGDTNQVIIDPEKMEGGDGSDAASRRSIWDDEE